jgi:hypothetical protein
MATKQQPAQPKTTAQRKSLAAKVAKDKQAGMTGQALRDKYGSWLTGPYRRELFREFGHDSLIARSYDRAEAKAKREALQAKLAADAKARTPRKAKAKPASEPVAEVAGAPDAS